MSADPDVVVVAKQLRYDLTAMQVKVSELLRILGTLELADPKPPVRCPDCQMTYRTTAELQEHRYHHHAGPLPDSWVAADRLVGADA